MRGIPRGEELPPRLAEWLLRVCLPEGIAEESIRDPADHVLKNPHNAEANEIRSTIAVTASAHPHERDHPLPP